MGPAERQEGQRVHEQRAHARGPGPQQGRCVPSQVTCPSVLSHKMLVCTWLGIPSLSNAGALCCESHACACSYMVLLNAAPLRIQPIPHQSRHGLLQVTPSCLLTHSTLSLFRLSSMHHAPASQPCQLSTWGFCVGAAVKFVGRLGHKLVRNAAEDIGPKQGRFRKGGARDTDQSELEAFDSGELACLANGPACHSCAHLELAMITSSMAPRSASKTALSGLFTSNVEAGLNAGVRRWR